MSASILTRPGEVFANIPGMFDFYPDDSVIFIAFNQINPSRHALGVTARVDIDDLNDLLDAGSFVGDDTPVLALVVSDNPFKIADAAAGVAALHRRGVIGDVIGCWATRAVATGEKLHRLIGGDDGWGDTDEIAPVDTALATIESPQPPAATRGDAFAQFERTSTVLGADMATCLTERAQRRASALNSQADYARLAATLSVLLTDFDPGRDTTATLMQNEGAMLVGLTAMADAEVRDYVMVNLLDAPEAGMALMQAVACTATDSMARCNALCLYALAAWSTGAVAQGDLALAVSSGEVSRHMLTALMSSQRGVDGGREITVKATYQGSLLTRGEA